MSSPPDTAVIFCAGEGTRLRPLTNTVPKCLVEVRGEPLLLRSFRMLACEGVSRFCVNVRHLAESVRRAVEDSEWKDMVSFSHEATLRGSAGALPAFEEWLRQPFYAMYGDIFSDTDVSRLWVAHGRMDAVVTMLVHDRVDPTTGGMVVFDPDSGRVRGFREKPSRNAIVSPWVSAGLFVMQPEVLGYIPTDRPSDVGHDLIPELLAAGASVRAVPLEESAYLIDIGTTEALAQARSIAESRR